MSSCRSKSSPMWFFTLCPLGCRCGLHTGVYAARGDAWRQTSTPHLNSRQSLCSPLLSRLIIRNLSQGHWGYNVPLKAASLNSLTQISTAEDQPLVCFWMVRTPDRGWFDDRFYYHLWECGECFPWGSWHLKCERLPGRHQSPSSFQ